MKLFVICNYKKKNKLSHYKKNESQFNQKENLIILNSISNLMEKKLLMTLSLKKKTESKNKLIAKKKWCLYSHAFSNYTLFGRMSKCIN